MISNIQISKGNYSIKNEGGVIGPILCTSSEYALYLYKVS